MTENYENFCFETPGAYLVKLFYNCIYKDLQLDWCLSKTSIIKLNDQSFPAQNGVNYNCIYCQIFDHYNYSVNYNNVSQKGFKR
jgi:hypothetical protein